MEFKSTYDTLRERLIEEKKLTVLTTEQAFIVLSDLNSKMAVGEAEIKKKEIEAEQELAGLLLNA